MEDKFPREIRDAVYFYVVEYDDKNPENPFRHGWQTQRAISRVDEFGQIWNFDKPGDESDYLHLHDSYFGTPSIRLELAQAWWHTASIEMRNLGRLLSFDAYCPWKCHVAAKNFIRHVIVSIPGDRYRKATNFDAHLAPIFTLAEGTRVTVVITGISRKKLLRFFRRLFPTLRRLETAGFRVGPGLSFDSVGIIPKNVEFSPLGWYKFEQAYIRAEQQKRWELGIPESSHLQAYVAELHASRDST
jgi:hypothetical protein